MSPRTPASLIRRLLTCLVCVLPACTMVQYPPAGERRVEVIFPATLRGVPDASARTLERRADPAKIDELASRGDGWRWIDGRLDTALQPDGSLHPVVKTAFSRVTVTRVAKGRRGVVEEVIPAHRRANVPRFPGWRGPLPDFATLLYTQVSPTLKDRFGPEGTFESGERMGVDPGTLLNAPTETLVLWADGPRAQAKGIVIWLHSAGGTAYEAPLCRRLVQMGWWVLESEFPWPLQRNQAYLIDHAEGAGLKRTAESLGREFDERLLIVSDAVNASLKLLEESRGLGGLPRVVVGASLGGFTAPAVCAGLDRAPNGVAFIDTGADAIDLFRHSPLPDARVVLLVLDTPSRPGQRAPSARDLNPAEVADITREFDGASTLCPAALLPSLARTPALVVSATEDEIVRRASREALWEKLGRPERWQLNAGHEMLVYLLPHWGDEIAEWIDRHGTRGTRAEGAGSPSGDQAFGWSATRGKSTSIAKARLEQLVKTVSPTCAMTSVSSASRAPSRSAALSPALPPLSPA